MRHLVFILMFISGFIDLSFGQEVFCYREAPLVRGDYMATGSAVLEQLDDATARLRLSQDFSTTSGPDVQVFLSNDSTDVSEALFIEDIGSDDGIDHFSGAITFELPFGIDIDQYEYIIFRCIVFNFHWCGGKFETNSCDLQIGCRETSVFTSNMESEINLCVNDGFSDEVILSNSLGAIPGNQFHYMITNSGDDIVDILSTNRYDFEGTSPDFNLVYGVAFEGDLRASIGDNIGDIFATQCHRISDIDSVLVVNKEACDIEFECEDSFVTLGNGNDRVEVCAGDGIPDPVVFANSIMVNPGMNYGYAIADESNEILEVIFNDIYDFESSGSQSNRVFGFSYSGELRFNIGDPVTEMTATECFVLSNLDNFLLITKGGCEQFQCNSTLVATTNWQSEVSICPSDGIPDVIPFMNSGAIPSGDRYAYIITNENFEIIFVSVADSLDFEGTGNQLNHVFGISYNGDLIFEIGDSYTSVTATFCGIVSSNENFLTIRKEECPPFDCAESDIFLPGEEKEITICATDGEADIVSISNTLNDTNPNHYVYVITNEEDLIIGIRDDNEINLEGSGETTLRIYGISFDGTLDFSIGDSFANITADGCLIFSDIAGFITVFKDGCLVDCVDHEVQFAEAENPLTLCVGDGQADIVELENSLDIGVGENYLYIATDTNGAVIQVIDTSFFDFEQTGSVPLRIFGVLFDDIETLNIGPNISMITSLTCGRISSNFLSINKEECEPEFDCMTSAVFTDGGESTIQICAVDGAPDIITFANSLDSEVGENFAYVLTDANNRIERLLEGDSYDFESSGFDEQRIFGLSFEGALDFSIGDHISDITAENCVQISNANNFLRIEKDGCDGDLFITGVVEDIFGNPIPDVAVSLNNEEVVLTNNDGSYSFNNLSGAQEYTISLNLDDDYLSGLSAIDLLDIQKHILNIEPFSTPYQLIAADVNDSGSVTGFDLIEIQQLILRVQSMFDNVSSWRFALKDEELSVQDFADFQEIFIIDSSGSPLRIVDFIGIKMGDVDASYRN